MARAVALHLEGKRKEALKEIHDALDAGQHDPELYSARGHLHFELEQFEEAARSYQKLLDLNSKRLSNHKPQSHG